MPEFKLNPAYSPTADQPKAIAALAEGLEAGERFLTLLGATGTGKTFTMAGVIERVQRPALVIAHNKTLAAQLCNEFREFFPENAVEYFVSYYDYYQPEAYVPAQDLYIEKDSSINDEIDRLRHAATAALLARRDVSSSPRSPASTASARRELYRGRCSSSRSASGSTATSSSASSSACSTAATTPSSPAAPSASRARCSRSGPPTRSRPTGSTCSATRSSRSTTSTRSPARSSTSSTTSRSGPRATT